MAFDSEQVRLAAAWRGRFLDSQGTWFSRFAPPAEPLGVDLVTLDTATPFAILEHDDQPWPTFDPDAPSSRFTGYRLDAEGVPTFRYRHGDVEIEDRISPAGSHGLSRRLTLRTGTPDPVKLWFRALTAEEIQLQDVSAAQSAAGLHVAVDTTRFAAGQLRETSRGAEWILQLEVDGELNLEISYRW